MAGEETTPAVTCALLHLVGDVVRISASGFSGIFKKDCTDLGRRISLLVHLFEEISASSFNSCFSDLTVALQAGKRLLFAANNFDHSNLSSDGATKKILFQFQCVSSKLENSLSNLPYDHFDISEEVLEQVELVRSQLRRATERYGGPLNPTLLQRALSQPLDKEIDPFQSENIGNNDYEFMPKLEDVTEDIRPADRVSEEAEPQSNSTASSEINASKDSDCGRIDNSPEENKKPDTVAVPDDFRCPISLELMRDPVIVASGQTYERSCIQRWIDCGNTNCPKTRQMLHNLSLTPNYVLRSLISQWCVKHNIDHPTSLVNRRIRKRDRSFLDVTGEMAIVEALVRKLSSMYIVECRAALAEIRSLSKRNTSNRILFAEAGSIPILVDLLSSNDAYIQEYAVTCILNLSIYENNKGLIMLANAVPSIVHLLRGGTTVAKENAAATLFSLSLVDENKIIIGAAVGAIPALVDLLQNRSSRAITDAENALFHLCKYHGNKGRAVRAGIITPLVNMLIGSSSCTIDVALAMLSVLSSHEEAQVAIEKANMIPILAGLLETGSACGKENAADILLSLCKRDNASLDCLSKLGVVMAITELALTGTDRARRKAIALLDLLRGYSVVVYLL